VIPAFEYHQDKKELNLLDICFGIGYNTLATLYYIKKNNLDIKVNIYSPEFDLELLKSLPTFNYPKELEEFRNIIEEIATTLKYKNNNINIEVFNGDAREYIRNLKDIDIVYQDAFSSDVNKLLWTKEYFYDIYNLMSSNGIITTYSIATPIRLSMSENGFFIYEYKKVLKDRSTLAFKIDLPFDTTSDNYKFIDMILKKERNPTAQSLRD